MKNQLTTRDIAIILSALGLIVLGVLAQARGNLGMWSLLLAAVCPYLVYRISMKQFTKQDHTTPANQSINSINIADVYRATTEALTTAIAAKDSYTHNHISRVQFISETIAKKMGLQPGEVESIRVAALVRDVGKLGIPDYILLKPGPLDPEEFSKIRNHAAIGANILGQSACPPEIVAMVRHHHEKYDGSGYPDHLAGKAIPLGSRIISVADVYDALTSDRCYREGWSHSRAIEHIEQMSGSSFDPEVIKAFLAIEPDILSFESNNASNNKCCPEIAGASCVAADTIAQANRELVSLFEIAQTLSSTLEMDEVLALLAQRTRTLMQASTCVVFLVDEAHPHTLIAKIAAGRHQEILRGAQARFGKGITGKAAAKIRPYVGNYDLNDLLINSNGSSMLDFKSSAVVPIVNFGEVLGTINLYDVCPRAFSSDCRPMLTFIAHQAASAVQNARAFEDARDSAMRDALTGLHNSRFLNHYMDRELSRASRLSEPLSILGIDLDEFKAVNDLEGHQTGDNVLKDVADIFRREIRDYDVIVRNGGDEFVAVLPGTSASEAAKTARRIQTDIDHYREHVLGNRIKGFGASIGIASYPEDGNSADILLSKADEAMYEQKRAHKQGRLAA